MVVVLRLMSSAPVHTPPPQAGVAGPSVKRVLFDLSKREAAGPQNGYKKLYRKLKADYEVTLSKELMSYQRLSQFDLVVMAGPTEPLTDDDIQALQFYLENGGSLLLMLREQANGSVLRSLNVLLEPLGLQLNPDSVIRAAFHKYHHPKEVLIGRGGVVAPDLVRGANGEPAPRLKVQAVVDHGDEGLEDLINEGLRSSVDFVYPFGCTLSVQVHHPLTPILPLTFRLFRSPRSLC